MTTEAKETGKKKEFIDLWPNAKKNKPKLVTDKDHYSISKLLLIHDELRGVVPGYYIRWNQNSGQPGTNEIKKGDTYFAAIEGDDKLLNVVAYYEIDKILPREIVKEPAKEPDTPKE